MNKCKEVGYVPDWLVEGRTILVIKYSEKNTEVRSYRPITCLSLICTLLAGIISDQTYDHLEENKLFPGDKKRSRRKCQGATDAFPKLQGKKNKFKHGLCGLQEGLQYGSQLMDHNYIGNGRFS